MSKNIDITNKTALVTGANRGIGKALVEELIARGAAKVWLGVRKVESASALVEQYGDKVEAVQLDVTNTDSIAALPEALQSVELLFNNAGVLDTIPVEHADAESSLKFNLEVNLYGVVRLTNHLLPSLKSKAQGAIVTVGSVVSLANMPLIGTYSVSKAAVHSAIQGYRAHLADSPILVSGVYPGPIDTDMAKEFEMDKASPQTVAKSVLDGIEAGQESILPDPFAQELGGLYQSNPTGLEKGFSEYK